MTIGKANTLKEQLVCNGIDAEMKGAFRFHKRIFNEEPNVCYLPYEYFIVASNCAFTNERKINDFPYVTYKGVIVKAWHGPSIQWAKEDL